MVHRSKLSTLAALLIAGAAAVLAGCSSTPKDETANWSPNRIFSEAKEELGAGGYERAIPLLEKLEGRAAGTPLAQQAQLEKAYAYYRTNEPAQAISTLDRFIKLHPASPALDYALYLKGIVNFNDNLGMFAFLTKQDLSERDQKAAKVSFESFRELVQRFPDSKYAPDARLRMTYVINSLAESEVNVARYYYQRGAYVAAVNRAQLALTEYQGVPAAQEALTLLVKSYEAMGMPDLAADARRVLEKNYPSNAAGAGQPRKDPWWKLF